MKPISKNTIFIISIILGSLVFIFFIYQIIVLFNHKKIIKNQNLPTPTIIPTPTPDPDRPISILLLGYGGGNHEGGSLTDSIIFSQIRPHDKKINLVSIPRDLWINISTNSATPNYQKINYLYPFGGGELSKKVISQIMGVNIDYYLSLDFDGFTKAIDQLGGIDLKIVKPFEDKFYPLELGIGTTDNCGKSPEEIKAIEATMSGDALDQQYTCHYETLSFGVGTTHVDGITALKFARSRHSQTDGGDFNRGLRQRQVILAIRDKVINLNIFGKIIPIIKNLSSHLKTDIKFTDIDNYLLRAPEFSKYKVESFALTDKNVLMISKSAKGQSILVPTTGIDQYQAIQSFVASISAKPTISPQPTSGI